MLVEKHNGNRGREARRRLRRRTLLRIRSRLGFWLDRLNRHERLVLTILALIIGVIGGYGAILFRFVIHFVENISFGHSEKILATLHSMEWWRRVLPPLIGLSLVAPFVHWLAKEAKGHGVPEVMEAVALRGGKVRPRVVLVKLLASAVSIGSGGSVGREGPIVQIGSASGSVLGQFLRASRRRMRILVGCGAAAGLAATFNAPIAGMLFPLEILLGEYGMMTLSPIVISSVIATVVSRAYLGNTPAFQIPELLRQFRWASFWEIGTFLALGLIAGALGVLFSRMVYKSEDIFSASKLPVWLKGVAGALMVGVLVAFVPNVAGVGYDTIEGLMRGEVLSIAPPGVLGDLLLAGWMVALLIFLAKLLATSLTLGLGGSGGIFAPSLFLGASSGFLCGSAFNTLLPGLVSSPSAYSLVGMGALVAGATHAPMTSILILFEMTGDYRIILPLMLACISSTLIATRLDAESIYTRKLARRGVTIRHGREVDILAGIRVGEIMRGDVTLIHQSTPYSEVVQMMISSRNLCFPVVDDDGNMTGVLSFNDLREHLFQKELEHLVIAHDIATPDVTTLTPEDTLLKAFEVFHSKDVESIPVVDTRDQRKVVGIVSHRNLLNAYNKAVLRKTLADREPS